MGAGVFALLVLGATAAAAGGGKKKPPKVDPTPADPVDPKVPPKVDPIPVDPVDPKVPPKVDPIPVDPVDPNALQFDLTNNWGGIPMPLRIWLARGELASGIPGLARFLAVKAWQAYRALQPYVSTTEAAKIAAAHPELARLKFNPGDGPDSKKGIEAGIAQGWPVPIDKAGWSSGSFGLFDILGSSAVWAGVHTDPKGSLPYPKLPSAVAAMRTYEVQLGAASYIVRRILYSDKYKVLDPGVQAVNGNSLQTWGNVASAYAAPDAYVQGSASAIDRKTRFLARAQEIGIDLAQVAYPWPPGVTYKAPAWTFGKVHAKLLEYAKRSVQDSSGKPKPDPEPVEPKEDLPAGEVIELTNGLKGFVVSNVEDDADAPLLVALHGRDGDETQLRSTIEPVQKQKLGRVVYLRGNKPGAPGYRFFAGGLSDPSPGLDAEIDAATNDLQGALLQLLSQFPHTNRVVLVGYSQGGAVAYNLAARGGAGVDDVVVIASKLPEGLWPKGDTASRIAAIHGTEDKAVSFAKGKATAESFKGKTYVSFLEVDGADHGLASLRKSVQTILEG